MWLQNDEIKTIQQSIREKKRPLLARLLHEVLKESGTSESTPSHCPACGQSLVPKAFPYLEFFVKVCPNQHGLWMSEEVCAKMRGFVSDQIELITRRQSYRKLAFLVFSVLLALNLLSQIPNPFSRFLKERAMMMEYEKISRSYWPDRVAPDYYPLPLSGSGLENKELFYFHELLTTLDDAISNRMNMEAVLTTRKTPEARWALYDFYRERQSGVSSRLRQMEIPEKLRNVHESLLKALHHQMLFYEQVTEEKSRDPAIRLDDFLENRDLLISSGALREVLETIREIYPSLDENTFLAMERRLHWLDVI